MIWRYNAPFIGFPLEGFFHGTTLPSNFEADRSARLVSIFLKAGFPLKVGDVFFF